MSYVIGSMEGMGVGAATLDASWQAPLAAIVGTYAAVEQYNTLKAQLSLAQRGISVGEEFLHLAQSNYNAVTQSVFAQLSALYDRYVSAVSPYEPTFVNAAFSEWNYTLDYPSQSARIVPMVNTSFDAAGGAVLRNTGRYVPPASRKLQPLAGYFAVNKALTRADGANEAYRYEEDRQRWFLQFYWKKFTAGANFIEGMGRNAVASIVRGSDASQKGIAALSGAYGHLERELAQKEGALANMANYWGSVSNGAFNFAGASAASAGSTGGFAAANANQVTPGFLPPMTGGPVSFAW